MMPASRTRTLSFASAALWTSTWPIALSVRCAVLVVVGVADLSSVIVAVVDAAATGATSASEIPFLRCRHRRNRTPR